MQLQRITPHALHKSIEIPSLIRTAEAYSDIVSQKLFWSTCSTDSPGFVTPAISTLSFMYRWRDAITSKLKSTNYPTLMLKPWEWPSWEHISPTCLVYRGRWEIVFRLVDRLLDKTVETGATGEKKAILLTPCASVATGRAVEREWLKWGWERARWSGWGWTNCGRDGGVREWGVNRVRGCKKMAHHWYSVIGGICDLVFRKIDWGIGKA